jgi:hypothetical protein
MTDLSLCQLDTRHWQFGAPFFIQIKNIFQPAGISVSFGKVFNIDIKNDFYVKIYFLGLQAQV